MLFIGVPGVQEHTKKRQLNPLHTPRKWTCPRCLYLPLKPSEDTFLELLWTPLRHHRDCLAVFSTSEFKYRCRWTVDDDGALPSLGRRGLAWGELAEDGLASGTPTMDCFSSALFGCGGLPRCLEISTLPRLGAAHGVLDYCAGINGVFCWSASSRTLKTACMETCG